VRFAGLGWATILAVAFCAIDFAGLSRLLTPEKGRDVPKEIWYLTGAWLLGATMNAIMTWWAVSLVLLDHNLGNEVLSRQDLLAIVPVFVAILVWITRILFIGAVTIAGERLLHERAERKLGQQPTYRLKSRQEGRTKSAVVKQEVKQPDRKPIDLTSPQSTPNRQVNRVRQRPPRPTRRESHHIPYNGVLASNRRSRKR
jgi:hypothetical protein